VPQKLIFTGVDMTCSVAPLLSLAMEAEKPISFLGVGQQIPEDLEEANVEDLIRRAMPEARKSAISAA
jgi:flagellar biosynthesis protein FlhF